MDKNGRVKKQLVERVSKKMTKRTANWTTNDKLIEHKRGPLSFWKRGRWQIDNLNRAALEEDATKRNAEELRMLFVSLKATTVALASSTIQFNAILVVYLRMCCSTCWVVDAELAVTNLEGEGRVDDIHVQCGIYDIHDKYRSTRNKWCLLLQGSLFIVRRISPILLNESGI